MNIGHAQPRAAIVRSSHLGAASISALCLGLIALLSGCAPDSIRSNQATGFNGYLKHIGAVCKPLIIGSRDIGEALRMQNAGDNTYDYFIDVTSKLYYNRISPAAYRENLNAFFGTGNYNNAAYDCILGNLPPDRPNAPM
jgi:hypothetical protein